MKKISYLPFQNMTPKGWQNLALAAALAAVLTFYILQIGNAFIKGGICQSLALDYCAFYSAGKIINEHGFTNIYNLDLLAQYQKEIYQIDPKSLTIFTPFPIAYLSIFILPFKYLSIINPSFSYLLWTLVNLIAFILYLRFFTKEVAGHSLPFRLLLFTMLSLPVYMNFLEGQVNIFLMICIGEFIRAVLLDKPYKAGAWLGGLLLKPQLLIIIIPFLLIQRSIKILSGFVAASVVIMLISFSLSKINGILALKNLLLGFSKGLPTNNIPAMMNWRMIGWHISTITSSTFSWVIILIGSFLTVCATLIIFRKKVSPNPTRSAITLLGIFTATCAVTWHAHLHMSLILIPPMLYLLMRNRFNKKLFSLWVFAPTLVQFIGFTFATFIRSENLPVSITQVIGFSTGFPGFVMNLLILGWAIIEYTHANKETPEGILIVNDNKFA